MDRTTVGPAARRSSSPDLNAAAGRLLRQAIESAHPWALSDVRGPRAVPAGTCGRCGTRPHLLPTCGPVAWEALCVACAVEMGLDAWCDGHADDAREHLDWARQLPDEADDVALLWWVATGEIRLESAPNVPESVRLALPDESVLDL